MVNASEKKKEKLREALEELTLKAKKAEDIIKYLKKCKRNACKHAANKSKGIALFFQDFRKQLRDLEKEVLTKIT